VCGARLYFDETQQRSLPRNQVHIAGHIARRPATRYHDVSFGPQIEEGCVLAVKPGGQMWRQARRAPAPLGDAIQRTQSPLQQ
jgi:hypothetical protein